MVLTAQEEIIIKKWVEWQSEASKTNKISTDMELRINELAKLGAVTEQTLLQDSTYQTLKGLHDEQAQKCEQPFKDFKKLARGEEV